ncbi:MAG: hypothetical protein AB1437_07635 [Pseudomonadota bacterium]
MGVIRQAGSLLRAHAAKLVLTGFLALPMVAAVLWPVDASIEQRQLAPAPNRPHSLEEVLAWPAQAEAWTNDHFGWRPQMVTSFSRLRFELFDRFPTQQVMAGQEGRLFLVSHNDRKDRYNALVACGWQFNRFERVLADLNRFEQTFRERGIPAKLLVVPSGPVVYSEELQPWAAERCRPENVPMARLLASPRLKPEARALVYHPLAEMRAQRDRIMFFPKNYFHWAGAGAAAVAGMTERHFWGRDESFAPPIPMVAKEQPSEIRFMFPGIERVSMVEDAEFSATSITQCHGPDCFPEHLRPMLAKLVVMGRYLNKAPGLGPRLVVIADSFGHVGAPMFSRYHREVLFVSSNMLDRLDEKEREQLRELLFVPGSDDEILFLYHDATLLSNRIKTDLDMLFPE